MVCGQRMIERHHNRRKEQNNGVANDKVGIGTGGYLEWYGDLESGRSGRRAMIRGRSVIYRPWTSDSAAVRDPNFISYYPGFPVAWKFLEFFLDFIRMRSRVRLPQLVAGRFFFLVASFEIVLKYQKFQSSVYSMVTVVTRDGYEFGQQFVTSSHQTVF
jgi:hypothetical protein